LIEPRGFRSHPRSTRTAWLLKKEAIAEYIARSCLVRILGSEPLLGHFSNTAALGKFWALPPEDRQKIWGVPVNVTDAPQHFDPRYISDGELGAP